MYCGWHRNGPRAEWEPIARGDTLANCADALYAAIASSGGSQATGDRIMLSVGKRPEHVLVAAATATKTAKVPRRQAAAVFAADEFEV